MRRASAVGAAAGLLTLGGIGVAQADTPPPPSFPTVFTGSASAATAAAAQDAAQAAAAAQQAAFEKASGATCTDGTSTVTSFKITDGVYDALATVDATCTAPAPSGS
jgi:hypothetical protein